MKEYLCTRPTLAALMMQQGHTVERIKNPFADVGHEYAWIIDLTDRSAEAIRAYYDQIGKPVPRVVSNFIAEVAENG